MFTGAAYCGIIKYIRAVWIGGGGTVFPAKVRICAKVNLSLNISGTSGGMHLIDTVVAPVDIYDTVCAKPRADTLVNVYMHGRGSESIPPEANNAVKAGEAFVAAFGTRGADIEIYKDIPMGAGLGGSAGVLNALAKLYKVGDRAALKEIADSLGSDTGYMLGGGFARLTGRGERAEPLSCPKDLHMLLFLPPSPVSTAECYRRYDAAPDPLRADSARLCGHGFGQRRFRPVRQRRAVPLGKEPLPRQTPCARRPRGGDPPSADAAQPLCLGLKVTSEAIMEERNLEFDDDGKIKLRKGGALPVGEEGEDGEIVIDIPDLGEEEEDPAAAEERRKAALEQSRKERRTRAEQAFDEAEELFAAGDYDGAGEKYLDSASLNGADWRPWFGVVRVQTRDLTDFSGIYDCEQAYDKAFRRMSAEDRAALAEKYVPSLRARAENCASRQGALIEEDNRRREEERPVIARACRRNLALTVTFLALFVAFAVSGFSLIPFVRSVPDNSILIPCIVCIVLAAALLVVFVAFLMRLLSARTARRRNARAGTTPAGEEARMLAETEELIRSIIDDLQKQ